MTTKTNSNTDPITVDWKISDVLHVHPELLDALVETSPAFGKLRNPLLRKVQSRLVTVGQAAGIAGIDPDELAQRLNSAAGIDVAIPEAQTPAAPNKLGPEPPWVGSATVAQELDVRPFQQRGEEPFSAIMAATRQIPFGQILILRNTFEPVPLYEVLRQRGFEHWTRELGDNDWEIQFFNSGASRSPKAASDGAAAAEPMTSWDAPTSTLTIDVSELVPPEPMVRILTALEELPEGATLLVHHVRRPMHLYPRLDEMGYRHETRDLGPGKVEVMIQKTAEPGGSAQ